MNGISSHPRTAAIWITAVLIGLCVLPTPGFAEHYLSVEEAQKLCFPAADRFEARDIPVPVKEARAIRAKSGSRVRNKICRTIVARLDNKPIGVVIVDQVTGKHNLIDYAVALTPSGTVIQVEILDYRERYGHEVRTPEWRAQFKGKTHESPLKLTEDIYNVSGATISCRSITDGIKRVLATYEILVHPHLFGTGN